MIPVVVRSSEEMLKLVPNELREASYALGVPKWLTIVKVVHPHLDRRHHHRRDARHLAGDRRDRAAAHHRRVHRTMNYNLFADRMMTHPGVRLHPVRQPGHRRAGLPGPRLGRALTLILIVTLLNAVARIVARVFAPKSVADPACC